MLAALRATMINHKIDEAGCTEHGHLCRRVANGVLAGRSTFTFGHRVAAAEVTLAKDAAWITPFGEPESDWRTWR